MRPPRCTAWQGQNPDICPPTSGHNTEVGPASSPAGRTVRRSFWKELPESATGGIADDGDVGHACLRDHLPVLHRGLPVQLAELWPRQLHTEGHHSPPWHSAWPLPAQPSAPPGPAWRADTARARSPDGWYPGTRSTLLCASSTESCIGAGGPGRTGQWARWPSAAPPWGGSHPSRAGSHLSGPRPAAWPRLWGSWDRKPMVRVDDGHSGRQGAHVRRDVRLRKQLVPGLHGAVTRQSLEQPVLPHQELPLPVLPAQQLPLLPESPGPCGFASPFLSSDAAAPA